MEITSTEGNGNGYHPNGNSHNGRNGTMLTVSQVAELLNAHPHSVRRWADGGRLHCYRIGLRGDRRFTVGDVDDFLAAWKNGHPVAPFGTLGTDLSPGNRVSG